MTVSLNAAATLAGFSSGRKFSPLTPLQIQQFPNGRSHKLQLHFRVAWSGEKWGGYPMLVSDVRVVGLRRLS